LAVNPEANAILIFLPGWDEIIRLKEKLEASHTFGNRHSYSILPLHSMVAPAEQKKVFIRPDLSVRKIILSTNVAETAITIDDVAFVIDSGRHKEKSYDPYTGVSTLQSGWISQASAKQRRGRAGRCQPGIAFHLYTRQRSESLEEYQLPEIMRTPLEEMGLQVKLLETPSNRIKIADFLSKAVEPPVLQAVNAAIKLLEAIGALEEGSEKLTVLGKHLASLPISPTLGKMLLYGVIYDCLDPILTVSCCLGYR
jgi:HrpA-like RNA helicase